MPEICEARDAKISSLLVDPSPPACLFLRYHSRKMSELQLP
jgi:hypothetical protein